MPGRYSYGVVLADYSKRGLIALDEEQQAKYNSFLAPSTRIPSRSGARSAQPYSTRPPISPESHNLRHGAKRSTASLSAVSEPIRPVITDSSSRLTANPEDSQRIATRRQRDITQFATGSPKSKNSPSHRQSGQTIPHPASPESASRLKARPLSDINELSVSIPTNTSQVPQLVPSTLFRSSSTRSDQRSNGHDGNESSFTRNPEKLTQSRPSPSSPRSKDLPSPQQRQTLIVSKSSGFRELTSPTPRHREQNISREEKIKQAKQNHIAKFQERSQANVSPANNESATRVKDISPKHQRSSESDNKPKVHGFPETTTESKSSRIPIPNPSDLKQPSSESAKVIAHEAKQNPASTLEAKKQQQTTTPTQFSKQASESNSSSRVTTASTTQSQQTESSTSLSSIGSWGIQSFMGNKKKPESPKQLLSHSGHDQKWTLPEIEEDKGFSNSIFDLSFDADEIDESRMALGSSEFGNISSGRDVTFDDDDTSSELSAACPPNISRFRDEESEFYANVARITGETDRSKTGQPGANVGKKKGFLSRLKGRS